MPDAATWPAMSLDQANGLLTQPGAMFEIETLTINGAPIRTYKNAPPTLRHVFDMSAAFGDRELLIYEDERISFVAHQKAAARFAHVLADRFGVQKGDRVAIIMRNYPQWSIAFWGALLAGAIATPMNAWWTGEELEYGLNDSGAKVAIVDPKLFERIRDHWDNIEGLSDIVIARAEEDRADPRVHRMEDFIGAASSWAALDPIDPPEVAFEPDDDATIMYTSGTTGRPKGALATHRAIVSNVFNSLACQMRMFLRRGEQPPEPDPDNPRISLVSIPFFHATGAFAVLVPSMLTGGRMITMYKWDADAALPIIERERVSAIGGVPAIAWQVLEHPDRDKYDLSSIAAVSYGGAPSAPELVSTIKRRVPEAVAGNGWGMTETCATATLNFGEDYVNRPDSAGAPSPATELKVVGANGETLGVGEVGELWCRSSSNCKAYWNNPEASAKTFVDGWVVTGDLARLDDEGFVYLVDRAKDMLIRGGENIYSIEVESALYDHPSVMDAAIVGIPHRVLGEEVGAVVQLKPDTTASEDDLRHHVAQHLAAFKVPKAVIFMDQPLPRNANGKVMKTELRKLFTPTE
ncbi:MAG: class I adenylate-forming enzyme family protein [Pseudomonadota bacterium]